MWNHLGSLPTSELETYLDARKEKDRPIFFTRNRRNVHQVGVNGPAYATAAMERTGPAAQTDCLRGPSGGRISGTVFRFLKAKKFTREPAIHLRNRYNGGRDGRFRTLQPISTFIKTPKSCAALVIHPPEKMRPGSELRSKVPFSNARSHAIAVLFARDTAVRKKISYWAALFTRTKQAWMVIRALRLFLASDSRAGYGLRMDPGHSHVRHL